MESVRAKGAGVRKDPRGLVSALVVLILSAAGTVLTWKYLPQEQFSLFILLAGFIFSFLLSGILYLFSTSSDLRRFSAEMMITKTTAEEEKARYAALLAGIGDGVVAVDAEGNVIVMNEVAESLLGLKSGEALGKKWFAVLHRVDEMGVMMPAETGAIYAALHGRREATNLTKYSYVRKSGLPLPVSITVSPVVVGGETLGAIEVFRDVTHEREVDKAKTEFVSLASHQLRTPLTAINWYTEMLLAGDVGKVTRKQKQYLDEIYGAGKRMVDLVGALLNVSRIDLGTFAIDPSPMRVTDIAESVIKEMEIQVRAHKISVRKKYEKNLPVINADPKLLRIVLQNLISNAVKYTPDNGVVEVRIVKSGETIKVEVLDNGCGIPVSQRGKIFGKLFRADNARERVTDGTGLGLYVAKAIIEQSGGSIGFDSEENKGTRFFATIPLEGMQKKKGVKGLSYIDS